MKVVFVLALQSAQVSAAWERVCHLCLRTVRSLLHQRDPRLHVLLACHEVPPGLPLDDPRLELVDCRALPIPQQRADRMMDKWVKLRHALVQARRFAPGYFMIVDADDVVSDRLVGHVLSQPLERGWYLDAGYVWDEGSAHVYLRPRRFDGLCGTSGLLYCTAAELPSDPSESPAAFPILAYGHGVITDEMQRRGKPLRALPFPGAMYITATGENDSGMSLAGWRSWRTFFLKLMRTRRLTPALRAEFNLGEPPSPPPLIPDA